MLALPACYIALAGDVLMADDVGKIYRTVLRFYLAFIALVTVCLGVLNLKRHDDWAMADWLINYSGGGVRRGLTGEIAVGLAPLHLSPFAVVLAMQLALYAVILYAVWRLSKNLGWSWWTLALVYSPATLAFPLNDPSFAYRKEILFFALLATTLLMLRRKQSHDLGLSVFLALAAAVCILSHEGLIVFFPYVFCALLLGLGSAWRAVRVAAVPAAVAVGCFALASRFPGNLAQSRTVCASLGSTLTDPPTGFCGGAIAYLSRDTAYAHTQVLLQLHQGNFARHFVLTATLALLPAVVLIAQMLRRPEQRIAARLLSVCALVSIAASVPLFLYGTDWTRWVYVHVFSVLLLLLFVMRRPALDADESTRRLWPQNAMARYAAMAALALYLFAWNLSPYQPRIPFGGLVHYAMHLRLNQPAG